MLTPETTLTTRLSLLTFQVIPIVFFDCRLPDSVIPAKLVLSRVEGAGIQPLYVYYMQFFRQFLTVIGITTGTNR